MFTKNLNSSYFTSQSLFDKVKILFYKKYSIYKNCVMLIILEEKLKYFELFFDPLKY
jgi:hypothetical protein